MNRRLALLFWCASAGLLAYWLLNTYSLKHAPTYKKLERLWAEDVANLENSGKLPVVWREVREIKIIGGTPETKEALARVQVPLKTNPAGKYRMEVLVVLWVESGKRGTLIQYNIEDIKSKNTVSEIGRTLILDEQIVEAPAKETAEPTPPKAAVAPAPPGYAK